MKRCLLLVHFILISLYTFSQDWQPFVLNQNSYYKQVFEDTVILENFLMDSILDIPHMGMQFYFFNAKSELDDACFKQVKSDWVIQHHNHPNKFDSAWVANGEFNFYSYNIETDKYGSLHFEPYSKVGESWGNGEHIITCIKKEKQSFRGIEDSVKVFRHQGGLFEGMEYILSKHFGFIKFVPTYAYYNGYFENPPPEFELIGFKKGELSKGYTPDFSDFFNLQPGDMLYYKDTIPGPGYHSSYYIDSIISSYKTTDSVHYEFQRKTFYLDGTVKYSGKEAFYIKAREGKIINAPTSSFCFAKSFVDAGLEYSELVTTYPFALSLNNKDTILYTKFSFNDNVLIASDCTLSGGSSDYGYRQIYSSATGLVYEEEITFWGSHFTYLIGSIIKGNKSGITKIPVANDVQHVKSSVKIYPNPASDMITIKLPDYDNTRLFELFDVNGKNVIQVELSNQNTDIDLNNLNHGIYFYRILNNRSVYKTDKLILVK
ncbi:T9SS type A sorting domain-containing protein [Saccharicrinis sp. FJH54]|uniref:T9SS type A sorting domain-containing protein n=1 Tax=Saccharicrinis sp. FJH54 TaxID=3344665 RepID=UPI0035D45C51